MKTKKLLSSLTYNLYFEKFCVPNNNIVSITIELKDNIKNVDLKFNLPNTKDIIPNVSMLDTLFMDAKYRFVEELEKFYKEQKCNIETS